MLVMKDRKIRFPDDVFDRISQTAEEDERSFHGQVIWLIRRGLRGRTEDAARAAAKVARLAKQASE